MSYNYKVLLEAQGKLSQCLDDLAQGQGLNCVKPRLMQVIESLQSVCNEKSNIYRITPPIDFYHSRWVEFDSGITGLLLTMVDVQHLLRLIELASVDSSESALLTSFLASKLKQSPAWPLRHLLTCLKSPFETIVEITEDMSTYSAVPLMVALSHQAMNPELTIRHGGFEYQAHDIESLIVHLLQESS